MGVYIVVTFHLRASAFTTVTQVVSSEFTSSNMVQHGERRDSGLLGGCHRSGVSRIVSDAADFVPVLSPEARRVCE